MTVERNENSFRNNLNGVVEEKRKVDNSPTYIENKQYNNKKKSIYKNPYKTKGQHTYIHTNQQPFI